MTWYVAELIVECRVGRARAALWEQQLVVLRERSATAAYATAMKLGRRQNQAYRNSAGETVRWRFKGLGDLTEVHSRLSREGLPSISPKAKLTVFWAERNKHRTAGELLSDDPRRFAPR